MRIETARLLSVKRKVLLSRSQLEAKFFDFLDENRLIFVVLSGRFQNLFWKKERFWRLVVTATVIHERDE